MNEMIRYSVIREKNPREIVLLRGSGCKWKKCTFCDYHLDSSDDEDANYRLNRDVLSHVTGELNHLEVINSGSFTDLDEKTMNEIERVCTEKNITLLHFECHFMHRKEIPLLKERFKRKGIDVKIKTGVETFDRDFRENVLKKGIGISSPEEIAKGFDEVCLLFGLTGQSVSSMKNDVETALKYFDRVCVNIMTKNNTPIQPDEAVIESFVREVYPIYCDNDRVDILLSNTDFGVGGEENE
jgi:hypothetical protein